ncbi:MAG: class II aldolase/adducin family protein [Actinomycetota bacterium]
MAVIETPPARLAPDEIEAERLHRKRQVALGYRIFASLRWGDLGDGHITARDPELTDHMWLLRYPTGFERATVDDLVLVRPDGTVVGDEAINLTAYHIHHPIHDARPEVVSVAHTHTAWGTPFCATGRPIEAITQEACNFVDDWSFFDDEEVQVLGTAGGTRIAEALGANRAVLLRSHGLLTACASVGETIAAFVVLERVCEALMKAPDAKPISDEAARIAREDLYRYRALEAAFDFLVSRHVGDPSIVD